MINSKYFSLRSGLLAATILASPLLLDHAKAQPVIGISITIAPPLLPVYVQPPMPEMGYVWTPGYWAYGAVGYYWIPGAWIQPPEVGYLWTPPYWGWNNGYYAFNPGYWGRHVGYYGGVNYGYGYGGNGYDGGRWNGQHFEYNRAANNFGSVHVVNAYQSNLTVVNHTNVSYTGGAGGLRTEPSAQDRQAAHDSHIAPTTDQVRHVDAAMANPDYTSHNNGHPAGPATPRPATLGETASQKPVTDPVAHPAEQVARPVAPAYPEQHAAPGQPTSMREPAAPAHPAGQAGRPATPARQPANEAGAPTHENGPQKQ